VLGANIEQNDIIEAVHQHMSGPVIWKDLTCTTEKQNTLVVCFEGPNFQNILEGKFSNQQCQDDLIWNDYKPIRTVNIKVTFMLQGVLKILSHVDRYELRQQFRCRWQTKLCFTWKAVGSLWLCPLVYLGEVLNFKNRWTILLGEKRKKKRKKKN
jgi:hypothetical protein